LKPRSTWRSIPEGSHLHTRRRENLKSHIFWSVLTFAAQQIDAEDTMHQPEGFALFCPLVAVINDK
jgi:hypothetical protein